MADEVYTTASMEAALDGLTAATMPWNGAKIGLYTNPIAAGAGTVLADLTQPTFTGYALSAAVVWGAKTVDNEGRAVQLSDKKEFVATALPAPAETVQGAFLVDAAGTGLLAVLPFDDPFTFADNGDLLAVVFPAIVVQPSGGSPLVEV